MRRATGRDRAALLAARLSDTDDFVGIEIRAALDQGKRVIPVLVGGAGMTRADALPESIRSLARRNAVGLRPERFKTDCQGLVTALKEHLAAAERERAARTQAERAAAEAKRQKREAEEAARIAAAEERARAQAMAGLSAEEIRKAEELANWDFVKDRNDIQDLRDHLARFPAGTTERYALAKLDGLVWAALGPSPGVDQLRDYLDEFPSGAHVEAAQVCIATLESWAAKAKAVETPTPSNPANQPVHWGAVTAALGLLALGAVLAYLWQSRVAEPNPPPAIPKHVQLPAPPKAVEPAVAKSPSRPSRPLSGAEQFGFGRGDSFKECDACPEMVVVPAGSFMMGSPVSESGRDSNEGPQRTVTIPRRFAVGKFEVTFAEFDACVADSGCKHRPDDAGWGRGRRPVINVSWHDAKEYAAWLSRKTGETYRLLSEAEWEYAARAGTTTQYAFGDTITKSHARYDSGGGTVEVGSFPANRFGLHDMHGNVWEWVEDTWHPSYRGAPDDGSVWPGGDTSLRVLRGGSWYYIPRFLRSADRDRSQPSVRVNVVGFRLARTL